MHFEAISQHVDVNNKHGGDIRSFPRHFRNHYVVNRKHPLLVNDTSLLLAADDV